MRNHKTCPSRSNRPPKPNSSVMAIFGLQKFVARLPQVDEKERDRAGGTGARPIEEEHARLPGDTLCRRSRRIRLCYTTTNCRCNELCSTICLDSLSLALELDLLRSWVLSMGCCCSSPLLSHLIVGHALTLHLFMVLLMSLIFITLTLDWRWARARHRAGFGSGSCALDLGSESES